MNELSSPKFQLSKMKKKRKASDPVEEEILIQLKQIGQQATPATNDDQSFGQMIPKRLTPQQKAQAKIRIQQLLYEMEFTSSFTHYQSSVLPYNSPHYGHYYPSETSIASNDK